MGAPDPGAPRLTVLDAGFLVAMEGGHPAAHALADRLLREEQALTIPAAVWVEFLAGVNLEHRNEIAANLLRAAEFHAFGKPEADVAVALQGELRRAGRALAWHDLQVAATARVLGHPLVSNDRAFQRIPGLTVLTYG